MKEQFSLHQGSVLDSLSGVGTSFHLAVFGGTNSEPEGLQPSPAHLFSTELFRFI
jgi:hypothetical protein